MTAMVQANLRAVASHALRAGIDILLITWVFQSAEFHRLVAGLLPAGVGTVSVQLQADHDTWVRRFEADPRRPGLNDFYRIRYARAQATPADYVVDTGGIAPIEVARRVAALIGIAGQEKSVVDHSSSRLS